MKKRAPRAASLEQFPMPDLWLEGEEAEQEAVAACGCRLIRDYQDSGDPAFFYCEKHRNCS